MNKQTGEYAQAGVDYTKIEPFKQAMIGACRRTLDFCNRHDVAAVSDVLHAHGAAFRYLGDQPHIWIKTEEGLGNKNWIAEWMYARTGTSYYDQIGIDLVLIIAHDVLAQGAMPVMFTDHVAAGDSEWFTDEKRSSDFANGVVDICQRIGCTLGAGESPALKYLVKSAAPVQSAPVLAGNITGIIAPADRIVTGRYLSPGDIILGSPSSGLGANGISLVIMRAMDEPDAFLTELATGRTLGEEALIPAKECVTLIKALQDAGVKMSALLPGTGSGIAKLAYDHRDYTYEVHTWLDWDRIPPLFRFMRELGVSLEDCITTFNWGIGYYIFVPPDERDKAIEAAAAVDEELIELGVVKEGKRCVVVKPYDLVLPPPGE